MALFHGSKVKCQRLKCLGIQYHQRAIAGMPTWNDDHAKQIAEHIIMLRANLSDAIRSKIVKQTFFITVDKPRLKGTPPWRNENWKKVQGKANVQTNVLNDIESPWLRQYEEFPRNIYCSQCQEEHDYSFQKSEEALVWKKMPCSQCTQSEQLKNWLCECGTTLRACEKHRSGYHERKDENKVQICGKAKTRKRVGFGRKEFHKKSQQSDIAKGKNDTSTRAQQRSPKKP